MVSKILLLLSLFLMSACGNDVSVSSKKLEYNSSLSDGSTAPNASGILVRGTPDRITTNGASYQVSMYSSYNALEFIAAKELNGQYPVKFKGKIKNSQLELEVISAQ